MPYVPHTEDDVREMLDTIGVKSIEDLFDEIPADLKIEALNAIPTGLSEFQATRLLQARAKQDESSLCFIGAGAYEHHIPAAVWELTSRGEFMTAYTPYQAEASQGGLQVLYEYQTMMANLTGMEVSNASLYDGSTSVAEAVLMSVRANRQTKSKTVLVAKTLNPRYREVIKNIVRNQNIDIIEIDFDEKAGRMTLDNFIKAAPDDFAAIVLPHTNFFGVIETDVTNITNWAHEKRALVVAVANPIALALLKNPISWGDSGADIVCGEGQPLGVPLASGGPYFGFMACKQEFVRQMPGRIIGRTVDQDGKPGFALTLQAREQHIRRSKATSNICTNQGLLVTAATIYMSLLGAKGLKNVAVTSHNNTQKLLKLLTAIPDVKAVFPSEFFHEIVVCIPKPVAPVLSALAAKGLQGGFDLSVDYPELGSALLICATETKEIQDLEAYQSALASVLE